MVKLLEVNRADHPCTMWRKSTELHDSLHEIAGSRAVPHAVPTAVPSGMPHAQVDVKRVQPVEQTRLEGVLPNHADQFFARPHDHPGVCRLRVWRPAPGALP